MGIGMMDATTAGAGDGGNGEGGGKVQKLYVEDEESDDGMGEVEAARAEGPDMKDEGGGA